MEPLPHHRRRHVDGLDAGENARHKVAALVGFGVAAAGDLVVRRSVDIVEDRRWKPSPRHGAEICDVAALSDSHDCTTPDEKRASRRASSLTNLQGAGGWSRPNIGWSELQQTECNFAGRLCRQCRIRSTFTAEGKSSASMFCHFSSSFAIVLLQL